MSSENVVTLDRFTRTVLVLLTGCSAVLAVELLVLASEPPQAAAQATIPNAAAQRFQQIDEIRRTNKLLERIAKQLENGPVPVRLQDDKSDRKQKRRGS
ncbi:MAG: hypothetical protein V3T70_08295 [Phycisphaerae bacterium]